VSKPGFCQVTNNGHRARSTFLCVEACWVVILVPEDFRYDKAKTEFV